MSVLGELSPWLWVLVPLAVLAAYTVLGLSGFGSTIVSVPILAHFLPISYLVPLMALLDCFFAGLVGRTGRREVSRAELKWIVPFMMAGFALGLTVLVGVPDRYLRVALGIFAVAAGIHGIVNPAVRGTFSQLWVVPAGILGGAIATVFGAGGPIYATYLAGRLEDKGELRSTLSTLISISAFSRAILYALSGLVLNAAILVGVVVLAPIAWLGMRIGTRIHVSLSQAQMRRAIGGVVLATGLSLLARAAWSA